MSYIKKLVEDLFRDPSAREVLDLVATMEYMANDMSRGAIDEDRVRNFLARNKTYLEALLNMYAKQEIEVEELIDRIVQAITLEAYRRPGRGLSTLYTLMKIKKEEQKTGEETETTKII